MYLITADERMSMSVEQSQPSARRHAFEPITHDMADEASFRAALERLRLAPAMTPFQSADYLDAFRSSVAPARCTAFKVCEIRNRSDGSVAALLPYVIYRRGPVKIASLPDLGLSDRNAPALPTARSWTDDEISDAMRVFINSLRGADVIDIDKIPPSVAGRRNPLFFAAGAAPESGMIYLDLSNPLHAQWKNKSVFKEARAKKRRLAREGVEFFQTQDPQQCMSIFEAMRAHRRIRFAETGVSDSLEDQPGYSEFYAQLCSKAAPDSPIVAFGLKSKDELVSAALAFTGESSVSGVLISINGEEWKRFSPGIVLITEIIDWAEQSGLSTLYFGTGMQGYKQRFGGDVMPLRRLVRPLTAKGQAYALSRKLYRRARTLVRPAFDSGR